MLGRKRFPQGFITMALLALLLSASAPARASEVDRLLEILVKKHLLTEEEAAAVRSEVQSPPESGAPAAAVSPPPTEAKSLPQAADQSAAPAVSATGLQERAHEVAERLPFRISGYVQSRWTSAPSSGSTLDLRRARLSLDGELRKGITYKVQADLVRSPSLLDARLDLAFSPYARLTVGQFKIPFSQENLVSSRDLITIERSAAGLLLVPGRDNGSNGRDIGAQFAGSLSRDGAALLDYSVGVFNGAGVDRRDDNNRRDAAVRLVVHPWKGLSLAGDYYHGASGATELARERQDVEFAYRYKPLTLQGEYIWGQSGGVHPRGWYGLAAWRFTPKWEGLFRIDGFNAGLPASANTGTTYLAGANWFFAPGLKLQINYGLVDGQAQNGLKNLLLSQLQFQF